MNIKKILAGAVASVMAVSTLAVAASADAIKNEYTYKNSAENVNCNSDGTFFTQIQLGHIEKIDSLTIAYEAADGSTGYALVSTNWGGDPEQEANGIAWDGGDFNNWSGANVTLPEGVDFNGLVFTVTAVINGEEAWAQYIEANPDCDGMETPDIVIFKFGGSAANAGTVIGEYAVADSAPADTEAPATEAPADTTAAVGNTSTAPSTDKGNADTGVEGVAVVAGLAIVAAGAIVVAKKRK